MTGRGNSLEQVDRLGQALDEVSEM